MRQLSSYSEFTCCFFQNRQGRDDFYCIEVSKLRYILLLRGINVGGKNKVAMSELKVLLTELGFNI